MNYLLELVNESQNQRNSFVNFDNEDLNTLKTYAKGKTEKEILEIIETIW